MSRRLIWLFVGFATAMPSAAMTAEAGSCNKPKEALALVNAVDDVFYSDTKEISQRMEIVKGSRTRTVVMKSYIQGSERAFAEVLAPARDKGTKFLKVDDEMWIYTPDADKVVKIAKHMLRKGMMGSDYSYEDALEERKLEEVYDICWLKEKDTDYPDYALIELTAKVKDVTYFRRRLVIDPATKLMYKEERYAKSGKMLKVMTVDEYMDAGKLKYPKRMTLRDLLRSDSHTEMITDEIKIDVPLDDSVFSRQALRR